MFIGIEATRANKHTKTGVEWYAWHLIQELKKLTPGDGNSWVLYSNAVLTNGLEQLPDNWYEQRLKWPLVYGWTQFRLSYEMKKRAPDVLWMPGSTLPRVVPKQTVVTVHDIGYHRLPKLYKPQQVTIHEAATREIAKKAARIVTVSEFSGREIAEAYGIDPAKIAITPLGVDHATYRPIADSAAIEDRLRRYRLNPPFILAVGRLEAKKNLTTLVKAFTLYKTQRGVGEPLKLVLIGTPGFGVEALRREIAASSAKNDIIELGYVPEADLPYLMNAAQALVHPSLYEGFGLPPLQAMACGCPVISSNAASLPEVVGDAGILCPPEDPEAFAAAIARVTSDASLRADLKQKSIARAASYTWEATAKATLPVLTQW